MSARTHGWLLLLALFGVAASLGAGHVAARLAFANGVNVVTAATVRSGCAVLLLYALLRLRREAVLPLPRAFPATIALGLLIAGQTVCIQIAVALIPVTLAILVFYVYPFFTAAGASLLGDERFTPRLALALVVAFVGLALVLGVEPQPVDPWGVLGALGAALCFAGAVVLTPHLAPGMSAPLRTFYMLVVTAAIFLAASAATQAFEWPASGAGWTGLAGLALGYAAGISGLFLVLPRLGAVQTSVVLNLEPVLVAAIAWLVLGEALTALQVLGAIVVVATVILFRVGLRERRA